MEEVGRRWCKPYGRRRGERHRRSTVPEIQGAVDLNDRVFLRETFHVLFERIAEDPESYKLACLNEQALEQAMGGSMKNHFSQLLRVDIEAAIQKGVLPALDVDYLVAAFWGVSYEMGRLLTQRQPPDPHYAIHFATALFSGGLARLPKKMGDPPILT